MEVKLKVGFLVSVNFLTFRQTHILYTKSKLDSFRSCIAYALTTEFLKFEYFQWIHSGMENVTFTKKYHHKPNSTLWIHQECGANIVQFDPYYSEGYSSFNTISLNE